MCVQNLKFVAVPIPEIIGVLKKFGKSLDTPTLPFLPNFRGLLFRWTLWMYRPNLQSVALPVPDIIAITVLGWVANPQSWKRWGSRGSGMVPFERALVSSYRPSIVTFQSLRVSEIAASVLQHATFHHPTSNLPNFSPCSLGVGGWPLGYEERRCWANCPCNQFPRFPTYVVLIHHQRYRQTDRQTDDMQSQYCALHYSASRSKN